jgi:hypothetical protein
MDQRTVAAGGSESKPGVAWLTYGRAATAM